MALPDLEAYPRQVLLRDHTPVHLRPLQAEDKMRLLQFFERLPEEDRYYLKENVASPAVIQEWTSHIDFDRVIPIVAEYDGQIVADASLHRSRTPARSHVGELRVVVEPDYRGRGLGRRLIRELLDIAEAQGLYKAVFQSVARREEPAINAAESVGFRVIAVLKGWVRDQWGNYEDLVIQEINLKERAKWWEF